MTPTQDADEDFEFLVNLLASDGADHDTPPLVTGSKRADRGLRIQRGSDGRLDLGQVKAFYENKNMGVRTAGEKDGPGVMGRSRIPSGSYKVRFVLRNCGWLLRARPPRYVAWGFERAYGLTCAAFR